MMKHTIVLGTLFTTMMAIGMSSADTQRCCYMTCVEANMMMVPPQPTDGLPLLFSKKQDRDGKPPRMSPDRFGPNGEQSRERRVSFGVDSPITPEHVMAVATEIDPELASQLSAICAADPAAFDKIIRRQGRRFRSLVRLRERDPELFEVKVAELKLDAEIYFVTESLKGNGVNDPAVQAQLMQLRGLVRAKTALSIRAQSLYIKRLEHHLDGLRGRLEDTTSRFDDIVDKRVEMLLEGDEENPEKAPSKD